MYADVSQERVRAAFGWADGFWRPMESAKDVDRIANTIQQLLAEAKFHADSH
jgi:hypothetical protein